VETQAKVELQAFLSNKWTLLNESLGEIRGFLHLFIPFELNSDILIYMGKKLSEEQVISLLNDKGYLLLEPYKGLKVKHLVRCPKGHDTYRLPCTLVWNGPKCKICSGIEKSKEKRTPFEIVIKMANDKGVVIKTTEIDYNKNHHGKFKLQFNCRCGRSQSKSIGRFKLWKECFYCSHYRLSPELLDIKLLEKYVENNGYKLISKEYKNNKNPLIIECKEHGQWSSQWSNLRNGHWCINCSAKKSGTKKLVEIEIIKKELEKINYRLISTEYYGNKEPITVQCNNGHRPWVTIWNSIDQGQRCPSCSHTGTSVPEQEILEFVKSIYNGPVIERDREILGKELDIFLPDLKIGIEHDGIYWHSSKFKKDNGKDNIEKKHLAKSAGVTFLAFYEDEWRNKKEIVKSIIKSKIGMTENKIYARKTEFVEIDNKEAKEFLNANHLEGYVKCSKAFGLKYNGKLVMCVTFRKTMKNEHELARMATLIDYVVVGGASRLLKHAPRPLISYSNNRISNGEVYKELGFEEITQTTQPSYFYTDFNKRVFRTQCMKIKDLPGTEEEQALAGAFSQKRFGHNKPLYRIYDYGHRKWLKID
jgi:hypothetical protein